MIKAIHPVAGGIALLTILTFWLSTAFSELLAGAAVVTIVKTLIPWGFLILIPALMTVGSRVLVCRRSAADRWCRRNRSACRSSPPTAS